MRRPQRRGVSLAWPLAALYGVLVVYASLYPFEGWRDQGIAAWSFLTAPWPRYWTAFDVYSNLAGYIPLGLLLTLALLRTGVQRGAGWLGWGLCTLVSLLLEAGQTFLQARVPSQVDALLNSGGAALGAATAVLMVRWHWLGSWSEFRARWLVEQPQGVPVLLLLWPLAALYPTAVPFGLGQVWHRVEGGVRRLLEGSAFEAWLSTAVRVMPLGPLQEALVVALCLWAPVLLGYAVLNRPIHRLAYMLVFGAVVLLTGALSSALTFGPPNAWAWLSAPATLGLVIAGAMSFFSLTLRHRVAAMLSLLSLSFALGVLNQAPEPAYLLQSLQTWEQGRFIRFHGLSQWLGWLWPFMALWVGARLALRRSPAHYNRGP